MTDPERISKRSTGLAAQLLQAGAEEQPDPAGMQRTLAALGATVAVMTTTSGAGAVAGTAKATSVAAAGAGGAAAGATAAGGTVKAVSATLLLKWVGIGVLGGVGLAGAAAAATDLTPARSPAVASAVRVSAAPAPAVPEAARPSAVAATAPSEAAPLPAPAPLGPHISSDAVPATSVLEVGAPLAAEVAYIDHARALLSAGQAEPGLSLLQSYEHEFPEARLLPEVLFLRMETCDRLGRASEARAAAQRLVDGFPRSPHTSRARNLLAR